MVCQGLRRGTNLLKGLDGSRALDCTALVDEETAGLSKGSGGLKNGGCANVGPRRAHGGRARCHDGVHDWLRWWSEL